MKLSNYLRNCTIQCLKNDEASRDDFLRVVKFVHDFEMATLNIDRSMYYDAIHSDPSKLSSFKTIDRMWRKVQEDFVELRGKDWLERQVQGGQISQEMAAEKGMGGCKQMSLLEQIAEINPNLEVDGKNSLFLNPNKTNMNTQENVQSQPSSETVSGQPTAQNADAASGEPSASTDQPQTETAPASEENSGTEAAPATAETATANNEG